MKILKDVRVDMHLNAGDRMYVKYNGHTIIEDGITEAHDVDRVIIFTVGKEDGYEWGVGGMFVKDEGND